MAPSMASEPAESGEQVQHGKAEVPAPATTMKLPTQKQLLQLHANGVPFVMPSKRGIDTTAPDFDTESFLDLLGEDVMFLQHTKLREILSLQANTEYLQRHGLNGRTDVESFRKSVPIVSYGDLEADILRLVKGKTKAAIFTVDPITHFNFSSGTTSGNPKFIPSTARLFEDQLFFRAYANAIYRKLFPGFQDGKSLNLAFAGKHEHTASGLKAGAMTTNLYRSARFLHRLRGPHDEYCSPDEVILCEDLHQGLYCHLLCALAHAREIVKIFGVFAAIVVAAVRALQRQWRQIVEDIRTGTLNSDIVTNPEVRDAVEKTLVGANPELAMEVERECAALNWEGILGRLFPNARFVGCVLSGSMAQYAPVLKFFAGKLPMISVAYVASECGVIGLNPDMKCQPEDITYMLWPEKAYYEFIPVGDNGMERETTVVEACDLEVGKEYEIVVTNAIGDDRHPINLGFYRYRVGDVIRVTSFRNTVPVFAFVRRKNVCLSLHDEKTDEEEIQAAVNKATTLLKETSAMELSEYTSTTDISPWPGRYVVFWEIVNSSRNWDHDALQECANIMDTSFNSLYRRGRRDGSIGPLQLRIVKEGTFVTVMSAAVARGASPSQYKPPRCVNHPQALQILQEETVACFHSTIDHTRKLNIIEA